MIPWAVLGGVLPAGRGDDSSFLLSHIQGIVSISGLSVNCSLPVLISCSLLSLLYCLGVLNVVFAFSKMSCETIQHFSRSGEQGTAGQLKHLPWLQEQFVGVCASAAILCRQTLLLFQGRVTHLHPPDETVLQFILKLF